MKYSIIKLSALAVALLFFACSKPEQPESYAGQTIRFHVETSRAATNYPIADYMAVSDALVDMDGTEGEFKYEGGSLVVKDPDETDDFRFAMDGSPVAGISVAWPATATAPLQDQSSKSNFLLSDALLDQMTNVSPASSVPVFFQHLNSKITFECVSSSMQIKQLSIGGWTAWCDPALKTAQLILDPAQAAGILQAGEMGAGSVFDGANNRTFFFTLDQVPAAADYTPGSNHTIILDITVQ